MNKILPRVSIVNCVSTAADMMRFSDESLFKNAGYDNFDYVVVKWLASKDVNEYLDELPARVSMAGPRCGLSILEQYTNESVGYVPNLRAMMNSGFEYGFKLNEYAGLVNTDCYFGPNWLRNLVCYAAPHRVINSLHITAVKPEHPSRGIVSENLGVPLPGVFNVRRFGELYEQYYADIMVPAPKEKGPLGYRQAATMPYLFHRKWWDECGPWELTLENGTPDVRFFDRVCDAGAEFAVTDSSIVYHHEAVERRGKRPAGAEHLREE